MVGAELISSEFAKAVRNAVRSWRAGKSFDEACELLHGPAALGAELGVAVSNELAQAGHNLTEVEKLAWEAAYIHLPAVFMPGQMPDTPSCFYPVPASEGTLLARVTSIAVVAAVGLETVSYGSENEGELFVNLAVMPGEGLYADKSRKSMKGHTDAVSFPVRGRLDAVRENLAPSPDFVCLAGLRNPDGVPTTVMPLDDVLARLQPEVIAELKKPQFIIRSQATFREGMVKILGEEHIVDGGEFLFEVDGKTWVRFSHSSAGVDDEEGPAAAAIEAFVKACRESSAEVAVAPGDVLLVNNRSALHGRSTVGGEPGGQSRWLLRSYGLATDGLSERQRGDGPMYKLFP